MRRPDLCSEEIYGKLWCKRGAGMVLVGWGGVGLSLFRVIYEE